MTAVGLSKYPEVFSLEEQDTDEEALMKLIGQLSAAPVKSLWRRALLKANI